MTLQAAVQVDLKNEIGTAHRYLYGANLEHIGRSVYGGHWAEMLTDRKFAGHDRMYIGLSEGLQHQNPGYGIVTPWQPVNPDYHGVLFVHDNTTFYTGTQSQRITIRHASGSDHGIQQRGLYLQAGRAYEIRLVLRGEGQPVRVQLGNVIWHIDAAGPHWQTYAQTLTPTQSTDDGALSITIQAGSLWTGCASVMPADHIAGHRADVVAALKEWQPTFMRWPGGNFASAYHWMDGIGDRDQRPSYRDPAWNTWESNDVGTDDFMALCRLVGSEPILTINMGTGTPGEAAAWVEYCNGSADTHYGAMRAANGHAEPYNVRTWFVGNEQFGNWQVGHCDAETYARRYREYADAMRAVDPDLFFIGVGVPVDLYGHWNELVLQGAGAQMDALSVHYYSIRTELWDEPPPADELYLPKVAAAVEVEDMLDRTLAIIAAHSSPPVPLAFDEWNTYVSGKAPDFFEDYCIADALYTGALMNACLRRADRIIMSAVFNLINVMGNYRVTPATIWKTPSTLVLELFTHHRGEVAIACDVSGPTLATPAAGNLPAYDAISTVDAAATRTADGRVVYLSVINRDPDNAVTVSLHGIDARGSIQHYYVRGDSPYALNTEETPQRVRIESDDFSGQLPAHSVNILVIPLDS